jgi:hypothetical protein
MSSRRKSEPFRSLPNSENLYGRLVDGFLRITDWPTGRKVALVTGILIPYHIGYLTTARSFLGGPEGTVDLDLVEPLLWVWLGVIVTTFLLSLRRPAWSGSERLPLYFLIFGYGTLIFGFVYLFGTMSTAYISYYIVAILVVLILFDGWAGALAAGFGTFLLIAIGVGEIVGLLPFAPALAKRAIDDQNTFAWFATTFVWI